MVDIITKTVKPSGGDYTSISAAITGEVTARAGLVARDETLVIECYKGDYDAAGGVNYINESANINGFTTNATHYVRITTPATERHNGKVFDGDGNYTGFCVKNTGSRAFLFNDPYTEVDGIICARGTNYCSGMIVSYNAGNYCNIHHNILFDYGGVNYAYTGITLGDYCYGYIWNNIFIKSQCRIGNTSNATRWWYVYNNTFYGCHFNGNNDGITRAKNNLVFYDGAACFVGTFHADSDYNMSANTDGDDATAPGTNALTNKALTDCDFVSVDYDNDQDFHIETTSDANGAGENLYADGNLAVETDIDGDARPSSGFFCIGADEIVAVVSGTNMQINISDVWKTVASAQININDTWKDVDSIQQNIGDSWKTVF